MTPVRFEAMLEAMACSKVGDEVAACSSARIEEGRQRRHRWHDGV
jgi:hypothetical protein